MNSNVEFEVHVQAPVVYGIPRTAFTAEVAEQYFQTIKDAARELGQWILFEHPQSTVTLANIDTDLVIQHYSQLAQQGCAGIAVLVNQAIVGAVRKPQALSHLPIPFQASRNPIELSHFVESLIAQFQDSSERQNLA